MKETLGKIKNLINENKEALIKENVTDIKYEFNGAGDSLDFSDVTYIYKERDQAMLPWMNVLADELGDLCEDVFVPAGIEINEGGWGEAVFDLNKSTVTLHVSERIVETNTIYDVTEDDLMSIDDISQLFNSD